MPNLLIYGPHAEEYSLAQVNRSLALALAGQMQKLADDKQRWEIKISADPQTVSRTPTAQDFAQHPGLENIYEAFDPGKHWDVIIYNNFPKDPSALHGLADLSADLKIVYIAWEESRFPNRWVKEFNENLDCVFAASLHTRVVLQRSGVKLPIIIVPNALAPTFLEAMGQPYSGEKALPAANTQLVKTTKKFKFLHNSTGMARKSPAELVKAYCAAFTKKDDVALIIKTTPNVNNLFPEVVAAAQSDPEAPEIELINTADYSDSQVVELYKLSDAFVSAAKAEGFNLPVLEAMYTGLPVIVTGWSGHMDFVSDDNAYLVDYDLEPARSHLDNPGAFWAEPNIESLTAAMREVYSAQSTPELKEKTLQAAKVASQYKWERSANLVLEALEKLSGLKETHQLKLGIISTFNTVCGIAEYSSYFYSPLTNTFADLKIIANRDVLGRLAEDGENVIRLWQYDEQDFKVFFDWFDEESKGPTGKPFDMIHIQYNIGFYNFQALGLLIAGLKERDVKVVLTMHALRVPGAEVGMIKSDLAKADLIQVLNRQDHEYLENLSLKNLVHIPHGNFNFPAQSQKRVRQRLGLGKSHPIIATHGFIVENKGLLETLEAVTELQKGMPELLYLALNSVNPKNISSANLAQQFSQLVQEHELADNVLHIPDFMDKSDIVISLAAADVAIFAYPEAKETASGAIRLAMAAGVPIIITQSSQLKDLQEVGYVIADNSSQSIIHGIKDLISDPTLHQKIKRQVRDYTVKNDWENIALNFVQAISQLPKN